MLAGAGAIHGQRPLHQPLEERARAPHFIGIRHVDEEREMEIAVADVAYDWGDEPNSAAMSSCVVLTHSASREIGTQTSLAIALAPGRNPRHDQ